MKVTYHHVQFFVTACTVAQQAPLSIGFPTLLKKSACHFCIILKCVSILSQPQRDSDTQDLLWGASFPP